jgi:hypothetical protein
MKLAADGWHAAEMEARKLSNALVNRIGSLVERDEEQFDVEGCAIDMGLYREGIPECMVRYEQHFVESPGPIVKIVFNNMTSAGISTETMIAKGAAIAALIECIELSGKSVELWTVCSMDPTGRLQYHRTKIDSPQRFESWVKVKEAGQPLDMARAMFALGHPSAVRRLAFRTLELVDEETRRPFISGYGMPVDLPKEAKDRGDIYVGKSLLGERQWTNKEKTIEWIVNSLREQNIRVNDATVLEKFTK